jgi:hypothetical protein
MTGHVEVFRWLYSFVDKILHVLGMKYNAEIHLHAALHGEVKKVGGNG